MLTTVWPPILLPTHCVTVMPVLISQSMFHPTAHSHLVAEACAQPQFHEKVDHVKLADQGHVLFSSDLSLRVSYVVRGRTNSPFITVPCFGNLHRVKGILILNSISLCGLFAGLHRPAGAALLTSDPWPANRNKVNISWAAVVKGGPENKFDPTSPEGDEWFPFQAGDPLALLFTALLLKKRRMYGVPFNCLPAEGQRSGYSPEWFIFFPKSKPVSTAPTSTWVHFLYSGHKSMRLETKAWERDGVIRCSQGAARTHLYLHFRTLIWFGGGGGASFFLKQKCLWFPPSQNKWCFPKDPELGHVLIWEKFHYKNKYVLKHFCWNCENQCSCLKEKVLWVWNRLMPWPAALQMYGAFQIWRMYII